MSKVQKEQKKKKRTFGDVIRTMIMLTALCVFCFSGYKLFTIYMDYKTGSDEYKVLEQYALIDEKDPEEGKITQNIEGERVMESPVDFAGLHEINKDVIGWLNVEALELSYPIVQGEDNDFYLHRTFKKVDNFAGSIFVEYKNSLNFKDENTIVYGHNMKDGSMFGTLKRFYEKEVYDRSHYFWIYTPDMNYKYEIFSCSEVGAVSDTYQMTFAKKKDFKKYIEDAKKRSVVESSVEVTEKDRLVTLSTCTANEATRFTVQGVLVDAIKVKK